MTIANEPFPPGGRLEEIIVTGCTGTPYPCPDLSTVDQHIAGLFRRIRRTPSYRRYRVPGFWADIDLLLDRRIRLATSRPVSAR